jgi:integrase
MPPPSSPALRTIEAVFAPLLERPVDQITGAEIAQVMAGYQRQGRGTSEKTTANGTVSRARAYLAPVLDWAAGRGKFARLGAGREPPLPVVDVRTTFDPACEDPTIRGERDRVLSEEEVGRLLPRLVYPAPAVLGAYADPAQDYRPIALRFLLLTAARREEVVTMRWGDVDLASGVWTKPHVKSTRGGPRKQVLPLSKAALDLLRPCPTAAPTAARPSPPTSCSPTPLAAPWATGRGCSTSSSAPQAPRAGTGIICAKDKAGLQSPRALSGRLRRAATPLGNTGIRVPSGRAWASRQPA